MILRHTRVALIVAAAALSTQALDGTAFIVPFCGGPGRLYAVNVANGQVTIVLRSSSFTNGCSPRMMDLSPDGRRLALFVDRGWQDTTVHPSIWIANNDGTGLRKVGDCPYRGGKAFAEPSGFAFTERGIYWTHREDTSFHGVQVMLTDTATGQSSVAYALDKARCDPAAIVASNDGRRQTMFAPIDTVMNDPDHNTRGPLVDLAADGSLSQVRWHYNGETAAHGYGVSPSGEYLFYVPFSNKAVGSCTWLGYHKELVIRRWSDGQVQTCFIPASPPFADYQYEPGNSFNVASCRNSDDYIPVSTSHPAAGCACWFQIVNWRTGEVTTFHPDTTVISGGVYNDSVFWCGSCLRVQTFWLGALPSGTSPVLAAAPRTLSFTDSVKPVPSKTVVVSNSGAGTLTAVSASVPPGASSWLSASVSGSGNSQTVTVSVTPGTLATGAYQGTITLSGGGAANTIDIAVTLNIGTSINAPSGLAATMATDSNVALAWTDNANNETGFRVEHSTDTGRTWLQVATAAANATSYTHHLTVLGGAHWYRVQAYNGVGQSGYSNTANVFAPLPRRVTITAPASGDTLRGGQVYTVRWSVTGDITLVDMEYSLNSGDTWKRAVLAAVPVSNGQGSYAWTVPDTNVVVVDAYLQAFPYLESPNGPAAGEVGPFTILPRSALARSGRAGGLPLVTQLYSSSRFALAGAASFTYGIAAGERAVLRIFRLDGSLVDELPLSRKAGVHVAVWNSEARAGSGCYVARLVKLQ